MKQYEFEDFAIGDRIVEKASLSGQNQAKGVIKDVSPDSKKLLIEWDISTDGGWTQYLDEFGNVVHVNRVTFAHHIVKEEDL
ncbi:hypothetical protein EalM132_00168 [Exiguobacterium phage vB_EalM-132]|nr:hypothetical protein EalM132_00168 [Exiguobacterium phage vB_EalM-132]